MMIQQVAILTGAGVLAFFLAAYLVVFGKKLKFKENLARRLGASAKEAEQSLLRREEADPQSWEKVLADSGLGWTMTLFVTRTALAAALGLVAGFVLGGFVLAFAMGLTGVVVFPLYARHARDKRLALCDQQMPQALEIVALALRAGHPLPTAIAVAAAEAPSPIADELRRACDEHDLGRPVGDVLVGLGARLPKSESVHTFVTAVLVLQQTGGNLIAVVDRIVENARARSQYRQKLSALTAEGRSSAKMLGFLPVAFAGIAAVADPGYAKTLLTTGSGNIILAVTIGLWLTGLYWTRRLVRSDA